MADVSDGLSSAPAMDAGRVSRSSRFGGVLLAQGAGDLEPDLQLCESEITETLERKDVVCVGNLVDD